MIVAEGAWDAYEHVLAAVAAGEGTPAYACGVVRQEGAGQEACALGEPSLLAVGVRPAGSASPVGVAWGREAPLEGASVVACLVDAYRAESLTSCLGVA